MQTRSRPDARPATKVQSRVLVATDGSRPAQAALAAALNFPWAEPSLARVVVAQAPWLPPASAADRKAMKETYQTAAHDAQRTLAKRWADVGSIVIDDAPASAIVSEAKRFGATTIVLGWRGHGKFRRLLAGSVARTVAARAPCPVLIVRTPPRLVRRMVVAYDASANAERAIDFVASLQARPGDQVHIVTVAEHASPPASVSLLPSATQVRIQRATAALNAERRAEAEKAGARVVRRLERAGHKAIAHVTVGDALAGLVSAAAEHRADVLVLGARATRGLERALLGSVANGAVNRARIPVLLVR